MTNWSKSTSWRRLGTLVIVLAGLLAPTWTSAATERQSAAYQPSPVLPTWRSPVRSQKEPLQGHVAEARRVLLELQAFVEKATRVVELGDRLKRQRRENERLRKSLASSEVAKTAFETRTTPMDVALSALTGTIVRNWLETVRLKYRSDDVDRDLLVSKQSRLELESRVATLERTLIERRTKLLALRAERAALGKQIGQTQRQIVGARDDARRIERQRAEIAAAMSALRRQVTSTLRAVLLGNGARETH